MSSGKLLSKEQDAFLRAHVKGKTSTELTTMINDKFKTSFTVDQIRYYKKNHKIRSGLDCRFAKGHTSHNKGKKMPKELYEKAKQTMFQKGDSPANVLPIGSETVRKNGYVMVKVQDGKLNKNWKFKHVLVWEKEYGPLPDDKTVIFMDGDTRNFDISNLKAIDKNTHVTLNSRHLRYPNKELTEMGIVIAQLITAANEAKRRMRREEQ